MRMLETTLTIMGIFFSISGFWLILNRRSTDGAERNHFKIFGIEADLSGGSPVLVFVLGVTLMCVVVYMGLPEREMPSPLIPGHTGWIFLGYFDRVDSTFDAAGPNFKFQKRVRRSGPDIPETGDLLRVTKPRRVMIKNFLPERSTKRAQSLICAGYNQDLDDTGTSLPPGTVVVVRDVGQHCENKNGKWAALWVRVAYP